MKILPIVICKLVISSEEDYQQIFNNIKELNNSLEKKLSNQYNILVVTTKNGILGDIQFELINPLNAKQIDFEKLKIEMLDNLKKLKLDVKK